mmetsp:Transcript_1769/g.3360  ORF Transcript_1769/g.3360 Transcript_1769/m.3360 type:complete len:220 (-) Transcript_1769:916-1575(-)
MSARAAWKVASPSSGLARRPRRSWRARSCVWRTPETPPSPHLRRAWSPVAARRCASSPSAWTSSRRRSRTPRSGWAPTSSPRPWCPASPRSRRTPGTRGRWWSAWCGTTRTPTGASTPRPASTKTSSSPASSTPPKSSALPYSTPDRSSATSSPPWPSSPRCPMTSPRPPSAPRCPASTTPSTSKSVQLPAASPLPYPPASHRAASSLTEGPPVVETTY